MFNVYDSDLTFLTSGYISIDFVGVWTLSTAARPFRVYDDVFPGGNRADIQAKFTIKIYPDKNLRVPSRGWPDRSGSGRVPTLKWIILMRVTTLIRII